MEDFQFNIEIEKTNETTSEGAKIKAIGVGGGGGNMINHMINEGITGIDMIVANTDAQALSSSLAPFKLQLGVSTTRGLGAGMQPEKGRDAALESFDDIKNALSGADIVFISAGMGGGTGTGAAPIVAQAAKEVNALTISVVTTPFRFEGRKRGQIAKQGIEELKRVSDSIVIIPNEKLLSIVEKNLGKRDSFRLVDNILTQAVSGISNVILSHGPNDINLDFADVKTVMSHRGRALMGAGKSIGASAAYDAAKEALESPLLDNVSINGAMGVLIHLHTHPDYPLSQLSEAMDIIEEYADDEAYVIFGTTSDPDLEPDEVHITIIATGFDDPDEFSVEQAKKAKESTTLAKSNSANVQQPPATQQIRRVVGGFDEDREDYLDIPTYIRNQTD
jgi:cell division protein FtsZ